MKNRRSIRLRGYDYSQTGAYFVTICVKDRKSLLGKIVNGEMVLNDTGRMVAVVWNDLPNHYPRVRLEMSVIMPNHFHGIVVITDVGAGFKPAPTEKRHGLSEIVRGFKTFSSRRINELRNAPSTKLWQRNYYERIIRDDDELNRILEYIVNNPAQWETDRENPDYMKEVL